MVDSATPLPPSPVIDGCNAGALGAFALLAGMKLDLFTPLAAGPRTAEGVAAELGVEADRLQPLLFALAAIGLLKVEDGGRFANTEEADHYLVRGRPRFMGEQWRMLEALWRGAMLAGESIRAARPLAALDFGSMAAEDLARFFRGLHPETLLAGEKLAAEADLARHRRLLDVGGGSGGLSIALCRRFPELRATVLELPSVAPITKAHVDEAGLADRIEVVAADIWPARWKAPSTSRCSARCSRCSRRTTRSGCWPTPTPCSCPAARSTSWARSWTTTWSARPAQPCSTWRSSASTSTAAPTPSGSIGLGWRPPGSSTSSGG